MNVATAFNLSDRIEVRLRRELLNHPEYEFERLIVRRVPGGGVCLEGVLCSNTEPSAVSNYVQRVTGASDVLNKLVTWMRPVKG